MGPVLVHFLNRERTIMDICYENGINEQLIIEDENDLFQLFGELVKPLRLLENTIERKTNDELQLWDSKSTIRSAFIRTLVKTVTVTLKLSIPWIIIFIIAINVFHTEDGTKLSTIYDTWAGNLGFMSAINEWLAGQPTGLHFVLMLLLFIVPYGVMPTALFLLPVILIYNIVINIVAVIGAKKTVSSKLSEIKVLETEIENMIDTLSLPLSLVPPDYRCSFALEYFCKSYFNGKASSLKEAIHLYDDYCYKKQMIDGHQQMINTQNEMLKELNYQSETISTMERKIKKISRKI